MPTTPHPLLAAYPVTIELPVQWGDMDAYGHVNNTVFFRYFESARMAYLDRSGFVAAHAQRRIGAILHSTTCRFRQPIRYPDTVQVGTRSSHVEEDRFTMEYAMVSLDRNAIVAEGTAIIVSFDYAAGKKVGLPDDVRRQLEQIEASRHEPPVW
jgi:acyl-CoA thioester hydrolase